VSDHGKGARAHAGWYQGNNTWSRTSAAGQCRHDGVVRRQEHARATHAPAAVDQQSPALVGSGPRISNGCCPQQLNLTLAKHSKAKHSNDSNSGVLLFVVELCSREAYGTRPTYKEKQI
jgi:hypothetical protein